MNLDDADRAMRHGFWYSEASVEAIVARHVAAAAQATTERVERVLSSPDVEQEWEHEDGRSIRRVKVVDVLRVRAALAGSTDPTPDTRIEAEGES